MKQLDIPSLITAAEAFCRQESTIYRPELFGVTDGKAIGTFVEHEFQKYLAERFDMSVGNSAAGLDLPSVNCDIKVTSIKQPQSSCPYKDSKQKIYGLGYNLILFVYSKQDYADVKKGKLEFVSCTFIDQSRTADYQTTRGISDLEQSTSDWLSDRVKRTAMATAIRQDCQPG